MRKQIKKAAPASNGAKKEKLNPKTVASCVKQAREEIPALVRKSVEQLFRNPLDGMPARVRCVDKSKPLLVSIQSGGEPIGLFEIPPAAIPQLNRIAGKNPIATIAEIVEDAIRFAIHPGVSDGFLVPGGPKDDFTNEQVEEVWPLASVFRS
jgi:hypothetical protein